ncbi:MAG TPA: sugar phosphate isomerase/epimerase [Chloroflexota bacterium]
MNDVRICLSTWSLHRDLGPMRLTQRDAAGRKVPWVRDNPQTLTLLDVPAEARRRLGVDRLEICQMHVASREGPYLDALARALDEAGASVVNLPIDVGNISAADPRWRDEDCAEIEGWIDVAARLGAPMVRVNANGAPPFADEPIAGLDATIASLRRLVGRAAARGLRVLIENHGGISRDPETILALLDAVDGLGLALDVGNFEPALSAQGGQAPLEGLDPAPLYAAIRRVAPRATMVHAKTERFDAAGRHLGWDVVAALRIVREAGFAGDVSIEYGGGGDAWANAALTRRAVEEAFA